MPSSEHYPGPSLERLLCRQDIWRGQSRRFKARAGLATGHLELDRELLHGGWPPGALTEICQRSFQGEWRLFTPALLSLKTGWIALLNPPGEPFSQALLQAGLDLDRLVVVEPAEKAHFLACFAELARTSECSALLAWQPGDRFTYTELRKCVLATSANAGLRVMFRPSAAQRQSSPAPLRLFSQNVPEGLELTVFKQKGLLQRRQSRPLVLPLPRSWQEYPPRHSPDRIPLPGSEAATARAREDS